MWACPWACHRAFPICMSPPPDVAPELAPGAEGRGGARSQRAAGGAESFPDGVLAAAERAMDALKSAGRALIRSPSLAKQSWGGGGRHRSECVRVCRAGLGRAGPSRAEPGGGRAEARGPPAALESGQVGGEAGPDPRSGPCPAGLKSPGVRSCSGPAIWEGRAQEETELVIPRCGRHAGECWWGGESLAPLGTSLPRRPG